MENGVLVKLELWITLPSYLNQNNWDDVVWDTLTHHKRPILTTARKAVEDKLKVN